MRISRSHKTFTAWTLYACVLFGVFFCGIQHGQMSGLTLSGLQGGFCLTVSSDSSAEMTSAAERSTAQLLLKMDCPLCSYGGSAALLKSHSWLVRTVSDAKHFLQTHQLLHLAPLQVWLAHSPRAPPSC